MPIRPLLPLLALIVAGPLIAQVTPREAAGKFTLDGVAPSSTPDTTPTPEASPMPSPSPSPSPSTATPPPAAPEPAVRAVFTLDTPIQDLIADPGAKAVLDKDLPGVSDDENLDKFKALSLRSFQPMTGGQMTDAMLAKVASDLDVLAGGSGNVTAPIKAGSVKRGKDDSR